MKIKLPDLFGTVLDHWIRRYHDYAIRGNIGSHYVASGIKQGETVFEHVIPANVVRDMTYTRQTFYQSSLKCSNMLDQ